MVSRLVGRASAACHTLPAFGWVVGAVAPALLLGSALPSVGAPMFAVAFGLAVRAVAGDRVPVSVALVARSALQVAIVLLGAGIAVAQVVRVGREALPVMLGTLAVALVGAALVGRLLGISANLRTLIGAGTGICGASAIAAVSGVIAATSAEVAYAVSTIFCFNLVALVAFPPVAHLLDLDASAFALWAGTAINDTSSVVAAAHTFGAAAGEEAVVVKLTRTLLIVPLVLALSALQLRSGRRSRTNAGSAGVRSPLVPWFLVWFVVVVAVASTGVVPTSALEAGERGGQILIVVALAAVGLSVGLAELRRAGLRPLALGGTLSVLVAVSSLALQAATGLL